ncbi:MAG: hypothetical protein ACTSYS_13705 [Promethearchaeota archaeon]
MSHPEIIAKSEGLPMIRQVFNSCGISSILMAIKPNKNPSLDSFLRKLEKKITKKLKISTFKYDFQDRIQFSVAWLLLHLMFEKQNILSDFNNGHIELENVQSLLISKFDEMLVYQQARGNKKIKRDLEKFLESRDISLNFLESYLGEHKTDAELKVLGAIFGLFFSPINPEDGGNPLGTIYDLNPREPEIYIKKIDTLGRFINEGAVITNYEYHWLTLREIGKRLEEFKEQEKNKGDISDIQTIPHYFKFNNSLSGTVLKIVKIERLRKYNFYCFTLNLDDQSRFLKKLKNELKLK